MAIGRPGGGKPSGPRPQQRAAAAGALASSLTGGVPAGTTAEQIARLGGTRRVAELTGRSQRQVQRWAKQGVGPRSAARAALAKADVRDRMARAGQIGFDAKGRPDGDIHVTIDAHVAVKGTSKSDVWETDKTIGKHGGVYIPPEVIDEMVDHLAQGDELAALQALEAELSTHYFAAGGYRDAANEADRYGAFLQRIDAVNWDAHPDPGARQQRQQEGR